MNAFRFLSLNWVQKQNHPHHGTQIPKRTALIVFKRINLILTLYFLGNGNLELVNFSAIRRSITTRTGPLVQGPLRTQSCAQAVHSLHLR